MCHHEIRTVSRAGRLNQSMSSRKKYLGQMILNIEALKFDIETSMEGCRVWRSVEVITSNYDPVMTAKRLALKFH